MTVRASVFFLAGVFLIALAVQIANRLSNDALNFAIGAVCGMGVSLPVSFGLLLAVYRRKMSNEEESAVETEAAPLAVTRIPEPASTAFAGAINPKPTYPQIIVVSPTPSPYPNNYANYSDLYRPGLPTGPDQSLQERTWKIVGEEEE